MMRGHGPHAHDAARFGNLFEPGHAPQIDYGLGRRQAQLHQRDQAHAAREDLAGAVLEHGEDFLEGCRSVVGEWIGDHAWPPCWISFQIFSGVSGISIWRTPKPDSASTTEFTTAGAQAARAAPPTALSPRAVARGGGAW